MLKYAQLIKKIKEKARRGAMCRGVCSSTCVARYQACVNGRFHIVS
jgi:hypothetical protein